MHVPKSISSPVTDQTTARNLTASKHADKNILFTWRSINSGQLIYAKIANDGT